MAPFPAATTFNSSPSLSPSSSTRAFGNRTARLLPHLDTCIGSSMISYYNLCIIWWISWSFKRHQVHLYEAICLDHGNLPAWHPAVRPPSCAPQFIRRGLPKERLKEELSPASSDRRHVGNLAYSSSNSSSSLTLPLVLCRAGTALLPPSD